MSQTKLVELIEFNVIGDNRGNLISLEENSNIPFSIARVYYMYGLQGDSPRGFHAHKALRQVIVCIQGSCEVIMDNIKSKETVILNSPSTGLLIEPMQWHEMHNFSDNCILMVLASDYYDESDYIRSYEEFCEL